MDGYSLVLTVLLLAGGTLADRVGCTRTLLNGCALVGLVSMGRVLAGSAGALIAVRTLLGVSAAVIMTSTLSILRNVCTDRRELGRAIAIWTAVGAAGAAAGGLPMKRSGWLAALWSAAPVTALCLPLVAASCPSPTATARAAGTYPACCCPWAASPTWSARSRAPNTGGVYRSAPASESEGAGPEPQQYSELSGAAPGPRAAPGPTMTLISSHGMAPGKAFSPGLAFLMSGRATAVLDARMRFLAWSPEAESMLGYLPGEVLNRSIDEVLGTSLTAGRTAADDRSAGAPDEATVPGIQSVRHRDGRTVPVALSVNALRPAGAAWLMVAMDVEWLRRNALDQAILTGLFHQTPVTLGIYDIDARVAWINTAIEKQFGLALDEVAGRRLPEVIPDGVLLTEDGGVVRDVEEPIRRALRTGNPVVDVRYRSTPHSDPYHQHVWSFSYFRLQDEAGQPTGVCEVGFEITDRYVAQQRLALLSRASGSIGRTLDVRRTAEDLTELVVPELADAVTVDLLEAVLSGQEPPSFTDDSGPNLCRVAQRTRGPEAEADITRGGTNPAVLRCLADATTHTDPSTGVLVVPLAARGAVLGVVSFARAAPRDPFDDEEVALVGELVSRTAVCVDNARRYARERATALTLQRDLLPRALPRPTGVEVAHRYVPAAGPAGVGGDWYDVIPLSGARVGVIVGDVAGHGLSAAATMGRLRTTVAALAVLDLPPDELLSRLDDLVAHTGTAQPPDDEDQALGVTCLYAVYDPVSRHCVMARAGHPPPVLVMPDGHAELVDLPAGPPLGLGGLPFESVGLELPEGGVLALYTDGLVEGRERDIDIGLCALGSTLSSSHLLPLEETCNNVIDTLLPLPPEDDAALLLVRVNSLPGHLVATWDIPADPGEVSRARSLACAKLALWKVEDETAFVVELVVSELVTNAIRYGGTPVQLRLIRERGLIVEVSDSGHTSPHLRRAAMEDEGGRGLFLVAQFSKRWGTRYTQSGKTIWTEVSRATGGPAAALATDSFRL
ncbi:MFS transporter [Streptomyces caniscabiei]|uniref:MFS transporter n=1 Tax=Streptomyces caniscabiei TaxID=2746961 RepID=UPI0029BFD6BC|nr:MFS transporter [Streptomyces caniscabiei]